jgi:hypothetical protein
VAFHPAQETLFHASNSAWAPEGRGQPHTQWHLVCWMHGSMDELSFPGASKTTNTSHPVPTSLPVFAS